MVPFLFEWLGDVCIPLPGLRGAEPPYGRDATCKCTTRGISRINDKRTDDEMNLCTLWMWVAAGMKITPVPGRADGTAIETVRIVP